MIKIIAAISNNNVIGVNDQLPWSLPNDLKHFYNTTKNHTIVMGRKTHEAIGYLKNRHNIIISNNKFYQSPFNRNCTIASIDGILALSKIQPLFIIGGSEIYQTFLPYTSKMYLTFVDTSINGNKFFPYYNINDWNIISDEQHYKDSNHDFNYSFKILTKK